LEPILRNHGKDGADTGRVHAPTNRIVHAALLVAIGEDLVLPGTMSRTIRTRARTREEIEDCLRERPEIVHSIVYRPES